MFEVNENSFMKIFLWGTPASGSKKQNWRRSLHPAEWVNRICHVLQTTVCGVWRTTTAAEECADGRNGVFQPLNGPFMASQGLVPRQNKATVGIPLESVMPPCRVRQSCLPGTRLAKIIRKSFEAASKLGID
jgi:hypothetical protein